MHYAAMASLTVGLSPTPPDFSHAVKVSSLGILGFSVVPVMVLIVSPLNSLGSTAETENAVAGPERRLESFEY
jgi:hypothetical protein